MSTGNSLGVTARESPLSGGRYCVIPYDQLDVADMFSAADDKFFSRIKSNSLHVLQPYLPDYNDIPYSDVTISKFRFSIDFDSIFSPK